LLKSSFKFGDQVGIKGITEYLGSPGNLRTVEAVYTGRFLGGFPGLFWGCFPGQSFEAVFKKRLKRQRGDRASVFHFLGIASIYYAASITLQAFRALVWRFLNGANLS
jgi:hypothetical protein